MLIACPECDSVVSDQAPACPKCGCPVAAQPPAPTPQPRTVYATKKRRFRYGASAALADVFGLGSIIFGTLLFGPIGFVAGLAFALLVTVAVRMSGTRSYCNTCGSEASGKVCPGCGATFGPLYLNDQPDELVGGVQPPARPQRAEPVSTAGWQGGIIAGAMGLLIGGVVVGMEPATGWFFLVVGAVAAIGCTVMLVRVQRR